MSNKVAVAKIGKSVGIDGSQKLYLLSDFPEQFKNGSVFTDTKQNSLTIERYNHKKELVKFVGINSIEDTKKLINQKLFTTQEKTRENCQLKEDEFFWFDIIGCQVVQGETLYGEIKDIEEIGPTYYFLIHDEKDNQYYLPYIDQYIDRIDISNKKVHSKNFEDIIESS